MTRPAGNIATIGVILALLVLSANAWVSFRNIHQLAQRDYWVEHTTEVTANIARLGASTSEAVAAERGYAMSGSKEFLDLYKAARSRTDGHMNDLLNLTSDNPPQTARLHVMQEQLKVLFADLDGEIVRITPSGPNHSVDQALAASKVSMDGIRGTLKDMRAEEEHLLTERKTDSSTSMRKAVQTFGVATVIAILLVVAAYYLIHRQEKMRLRNLREQNRLSNYNQLLIESTGEGIYGVDRAGNCTFLNAAGARILKMDAAGAIGKHMHTLTHHTRADGSPYPAEQCPIYLTIQTAKGCRVDDELFWRSDGTSFMVEYSASPIRNFGQIEGVVVAFSDITVRKQTEEALKRTRDEAEKARAEAETARSEAEAARVDAEAANVAKSQFLANMSHELRTPLNAVIMYSELLQEEAVDRGVDSFIPDLDKIRAGGKHLLALVNGVLDLSKIEAGKMDLYLETFEVPAMVRDVIMTVEPLVQKKGNTLEVICPPEVGAMHADLTKVRQILFNLLSNSSKFTEKGLIKLVVKRVEADGHGNIVFDVIDTGIGMTSAQIAKLFQPFTQADESTTRRFGGTGLGLTISRRFCQMMGGEVSVVSEEGKGSIFTVVLPARVAPIEQHGQTPKPGVASDQRKVGAATVLIIDDEPSVRDLMSRTLSSEDTYIVTASNGEEGLQTARELKPDLIFLDVMMPRMDGWSVLASLKADPELTAIPVVMLTIVGDHEMGYTLGASEYLTKPIDRSTLATVVEKYRQRGTSKVVLIVDDDDATRQVVTRTLTREGWTVVEAENGRVGMERLKKYDPDLVLLDLAMPEMDGFQFLTALRTDGVHATVPVVVLTSKDLTISERSQLTGRVEKVIQKGDYSREALLREVKQLVIKHTTDAHQSDPQSV
jgi:PAS domain S-box-containing protein